MNTLPQKNDDITMAETVKKIDGALKFFSLTKPKPRFQGYPDGFSQSIIGWPQDL